MTTMGPTRARYSEQWAGNLLRMVRAKRGWSQRQLATAAGVPQSTIARIESATRQPTLPLLDRIIVAAGLELRTRLEPYDRHDDVLDALAAATPEERAAERTRHGDELVRALRETAPPAP
ncbi:MAG TPA: helix-turn-helix transcriptional regulator [Mycobacteriales bacterium]|jgi:transcriptional regulator with XRE-family HTH domain|nr:helix-turn-helix transcriptional regulator [Mycobacteriales bacterium]